MKHEDQLLTVKELADYLGVPVATIYAWRYRRQGPPGFRVGKHVRYRWSDISEWIESRLNSHRPDLVSHVGRRVEKGGR